MRRGTELMAAAPTGWSRPGFVTRPTPSPPSIVTPGPSLRATVANTCAPRVTSGSSPGSFSTAQGDGVRAHLDVQHVEREVDALRGAQANALLPDAGEQHPGGGLRGGGGAGARGVAEAQAFSVFFDVPFHQRSIW
jgi:hypothetical protein